MAQLLFVCSGNICRSPFAERLTALMLANQSVTGWTVSSAGTAAIVGSGMETQMRERLKARGGTSRGFAARQVDHTMLEQADLILGMETQHLAWVLEESPLFARKAYTLGQIVRFIEESGTDAVGADFLEQAREGRSRVRPEDDVPDPYRKGPEAADRAAATLTAHLEKLVSHLR